MSGPGIYPRRLMIPSFCSRTMSRLAAWGDYTEPWGDGCVNFQSLASMSVWLASQGIVVQPLDPDVPADRACDRAGGFTPLVRASHALVMTNPAAHGFSIEKAASGEADDDDRLLRASRQEGDRRAVDQNMQGVVRNDQQPH